MMKIIFYFVLIIAIRQASFTFELGHNFPYTTTHPTLTCKTSDVIVVKLLDGRPGSVNGVQISTSGHSFPVVKGTVLRISLPSGTKLSFTSTFQHNARILSETEPNSLFSYDFLPHATQNILNPLGSTVNLKCTIKSTDASDVMVGRMVSGTGSVNGQVVTAAGNSFTVTNGAVFTISASGRSVVSITNGGSSKVHADCDLALSEPEAESNSFLSYDFPPQAVQNILNPLGWTVNLKCTIKSKDDSNLLVGKVVSGTGSVNGQEVTTSGSSFTVKNGDIFKISASGRSVVSIRNKGTSKVHADCDLDLSEPRVESNSFLSL